MFPARAAWNLALATDLTAPPAMGGHLGFFPLSEGRLAAYNLEHGTLLWVVPAPTALEPAIGDALVFVVESSALVALRQETGATAWRIPFDEPLSAPPVWDNGWLIAVTASGSTLAFRASDGALIWRRDIQGGVRARPSLAADRVYLPAAGGRVIALAVDTGAVVWERRIGGEANEILPYEDRLYVGSTDNYLYSILAGTGEIAWRWSTGGDVIGRPDVDARSVYFVSFDNVLRALNRRSGVQRWKRVLPFRPTRGPVRTGDAVIVSGLSRQVLAFAVKDGNPAGDVQGAAGELAAPPFLASDTAVPTLLLVTRDFAEGTIVRALTRTYEPSAAGLNGPLPNPTPVPRPPGAAAETSASPPTTTASPTTAPPARRERSPKTEP